MVAERLLPDEIAVKVDGVEDVAVRADVHGGPADHRPHADTRQGVGPLDLRSRWVDCNETLLVGPAVDGAIRTDDGPVDLARAQDSYTPQHCVDTVVHRVQEAGVGAEDDVAGCVDYRT